ncbi:MAG: glycosyltransferase family 2 protein [Candidatus Riflebacteria bacterium]
MKRKIDLTIGMPVFNGEKTIQDALDCLLSQTFSNFKIIVSDNCSNDQSLAILKENAEKDKRIEIFQQPNNIGGKKNFEFVLQKAETEFFMWAAVDDKLKPDFIEKNIAVLMKNDQIVCSVSRVKMAGFEYLSHLEQGTRAIMGEAKDKVRRFLENPGLNSRFYGIFKTDCLKRSYLNFPDYAFDWSVMLETLKYGDHYELESEETLLVRGSKGVSQSLLCRQMRKTRQPFLFKVFPLLEFSIFTVKRLNLALDLIALWYLLRLNWGFTKKLLMDFLRLLRDK